MANEAPNLINQFFAKQFRSNIALDKCLLGLIIAFEKVKKYSLMFNWFVGGEFKFQSFPSKSHDEMNVDTHVKSDDGKDIYNSTTDNTITNASLFTNKHTADNTNNDTTEFTNFATDSFNCV